MLKIILVDAHQNDICQLFQQNFEETHPLMIREFNIDFNINDAIEKDMAKLKQFAPPEGRLIIAELNEEKAGCAALRKIGENIGEVKRMYVKPEFRRKGIGRALLQAIIDEASKIGYSKIQLDTPYFATAAQSLYREFGFQKTSPYPESDIPEHLHPQWIFMELVIATPTSP
jgi:putative acetyltransferase